MGRLRNHADLAGEVVGQAFERLIRDHDATPATPAEHTLDFRMVRVTEDDDREAALGQIPRRSLRPRNELTGRVNHAVALGLDVAHDGFTDTVRRNRNRVGRNIVGGAVFLDTDTGVFQARNHLWIMDDLAEGRDAGAVGCRLLHHVDRPADAEAEAHVAGAVNPHAAAPGFLVSPGSASAVEVDSSTR